MRKPLTQTQTGNENVHHRSDYDVPPILTVESGLLFALGWLALVCAYLCFRWTFFIRSIDLGNNDFLGLIYLIIEGILLLISYVLAVASFVGGGLGLSARFHKLLPALCIGFGVVALLLIALGFVC